MQKALVVDDSRAMRGILSKILVRNGFEVEQAEDGSKALRWMLNEPGSPTLVCTDYNMPEMNGLELIRKMRGILRLKKVPVIMITTETHLHSMESAFQAGADEYVMKPFTADMIQDKLRVLGMLAE
jgi:two-component system chemotaxis response regulator CheY